MIPPKSDGEFAAAMENVLTVYAKPVDPEHPVVCMDEQPIQLLKEVRKVIPGTKKHAKRVDFEYERAGTASIFLFCEPLVGWRQVTVRQQRTKIDWAQEVAEMMEKRYPEARKVTLICDNLNTHTPGAIYEAFPAERARKILERLDICHTPKHGSWLNISEIELSCMTRQCVKRRRFGSIEHLKQETKPWYTRTNAKHRMVDWHMNIGDARTKLKSVYPKFIE